MSKMFDKITDMLGMGEEMEHEEYEEEIEESTEEQVEDEIESTLFDSKKDSEIGSEKIEMKDKTDFKLDFKSSTKFDTKSSANIVDFKDAVEGGSTKYKSHIVFVTPEGRNDAQEICDYLLNKKIVAFNTNNMEAHEAMRLFDIVCGACYVLNGNLKKIGDNVHILTPSNVSIDNDISEEIGKTIFGTN